MLKKLNIMDYSLLLGIEKIQDDSRKNRLSQNRKSKSISNVDPERRATYNMMDAAGMNRH
jgi:hypothetical protein